MENNKQKISFILFPEKEIVIASHGETILEAILRKKIEINHSCGGMGTCGTCLVYIDNRVGELNPRNIVEAEMAAERGFADKERLACQTCPIDNLQVRKPN